MGHTGTALHPEDSAGTPAPTVPRGVGALAGTVTAKCITPRYRRGHVNRPGTEDPQGRRDQETSAFTVHRAGRAPLPFVHPGPGCGTQPPHPSQRGRAIAFSTSYSNAPRCPAPCPLSPTQGSNLRLTTLCWDSGLRRGLLAAGAWEGAPKKPGGRINDPPLSPRVQGPPCAARNAQGQSAPSTACLILKISSPEKPLQSTSPAQPGAEAATTDIQHKSTASSCLSAIPTGGTAAAGLRGRAVLAKKPARDEEPTGWEQDSSTQSCPDLHPHLVPQPCSPHHHTVPATSPRIPLHLPMVLPRPAPSR